VSRDFISITRTQGRYLVVQCDDRWEEMTKDEALYVIANWLISGDPSTSLPYLRNAREHRKFYERMARPVPDHEALVPKERDAP
jgi:hypothetical protein